MKSIHIVTILFLTISVNVVSQTLNQTIRGQVVDTETQSPLPGVTVVLNTNPLIGTITDVDGRFILNEVVIKSSIHKDRPQNSMALISARSFTVEETRRYAGGFDDPARMASAFAGVSSGNLEDNAMGI